MSFDTLVDHFRNQEVLGELTMLETQAFVELLILTVLIDGEITEEELEGLSEQWGQLPFAGDDALETLVGEHGAETREFLETRVHDPKEVDEFLERVAAKLTRPHTQEAAVQMVAAVAFADGLDSAELTLCENLGSKFGFEVDKVGELVDEIAK